MGKKEGLVFDLFHGRKNTCIIFGLKLREYSGTPYPTYFPKNKL
jgi:hypothetical protein